MSEWSVRRKVVAVLAIPVVLAAVFGGMRVSTELTAASDYSMNQQRATVLGPAIDYLAATERLAMPSGLSAQLGDGKTSADDAYDAAKSTLKNAAGNASLTETQSKNVDSMIQIGDTLKSGTGTGITATVPVQLSDMNRMTTQLINSTLNNSGTPDPRVQALIQSLTARLSLAKQQLLIQSAQQKTSVLGSVWLAAEIGVEGAALDNLNAVVGGPRIAKLTTANGTRLGQATNNKVADLVATPDMFQTYDALNDRLLTKVQDELAANASASKKRALADSGIILLAILASLLLALLVARALIVPLRKVRVGALEVANEKLPETVARIRDGKEPEEFTPIPVHSREELGQLARAVDDMHRQAVNLATGEAHLRSQVGAMFVTLSRRNTTLVNQQLALIEALEQDEEDPQRLEQLFSLDHLATRMRRTAESLVILGGTSGRTAGFEELSVSDVIHAAVSEVQDYQRVRIDAAPDRMIAGRAASDVVHLMAELIDNALSYSPPGSPVTIQAAEEDGKVEIEIMDNGLGMAGDALARANESLKRGGEVTVDTARRMGLFVVSRLAEEHGLKIKLRRNTNGGGIIASITLPRDVLVSDEPVEHVSAIDAPAQPEPVAPVVDEEPEEEYDPYLERIEEAIAAVTGLPRRRPGGHNTEPVAPPAAAVSMFDPAPANPELPAAFEPAALPGLVDADLSSGSEESDAIALPAAETEPETERLAEVVTPDFGAERRDPWAASVHEVAEAEEGTVLDEVAEADEDTVLAEVAEVDVDAEVDEVDALNAPFVDSDFESGFASTVAAPEEAVEEADEVTEMVSESVEPRPEVVDEPVREPAAFGVTTESWRPDPEVRHDFHSVETPEEPVALTEEVAPVPVEEPAVRLQIRRPLSAAPAAQALEGDFVADTDHTDDSPIFGQLRSNWLSDDDEAPWQANEVDRGWNAAERAESSDAEGQTRTGLPIRRPGGRLLPGGVSQEPAKVDRDPEAIRNRLAAHAAGVSRGRAAAAAQPANDDYAHEETGPA
ncbi:MAG TPA: ATP-binding protein [Nocardioides sp.]|nr:ATP-binding protein [Nocardioides sp.]